MLVAREEQRARTEQAIRVRAALDAALVAADLPVTARLPFHVRERLGLDCQLPEVRVVVAGISPSPTPVGEARLFGGSIHAPPLLFTKTSSLESRDVCSCACVNPHPLPMHPQGTEGVEQVVTKVRTEMSNRAKINTGLVAARLPVLDMWGAAPLSRSLNSCPVEPGQALSEEQVRVCTPKAFCQTLVCIYGMTGTGTGAHAVVTVLRALHLVLDKQAGHGRGGRLERGPQCWSCKSLQVHED